jgi:hypothetical protein
MAVDPGCFVSNSTVGPHSLALLSCGYATIQLVEFPIPNTVSTWLRKISHPQFLVLQNSRNTQLTGL